jgi:uncharacterized membrane protein YbhN (UPF0104 family)
LKVGIPLLIGGGVLWYTYRDFEFSKAEAVLWHGMNWMWMVVSLLFGVLSHLLRGWRWRQTLEPLDEHPSATHCIYAIFISYAANLVIPRIGELSRCGVLRKYDRVSFPKSLGTVVTERLIDSLCMVLITAVAFLLQWGVFVTFFRMTGVKRPAWAELVADPACWLIAGGTLLFLFLLYHLLKRFAFWMKVKEVGTHVWQGIRSLRQVKNKPLFLFYTLAMWACYFFHFYLTFYCFSFTASLGWMAGLVIFVVGSLAVVVPTPNGAGPWHFAVISMMVLYGIGKEEAAIFALIVHGIQTLLIILLGIYGLAALPFTNKK